MFFPTMLRSEPNVVLPKRMAQHRDMRARLFVVGDEITPEGGMNSEGTEKICSHGEAFQMLGVAMAAESELLIMIRGHGNKRVVLLAKIEEVRIAENVRHCAVF